MSFCCDCCVLPGRGLCDELITRPEESYILWCVVVCGLETSWIRRLWPTGGCRAKNKQTNSMLLIVILCCFLTIFHTAWTAVAVVHICKRTELVSWYRVYLITAVVAGYPDVWRLSQRKVYLDQEHYKMNILCVWVFPDTRKEERVTKLIFLCNLLDGWKRATMDGREGVTLAVHRTPDMCAGQSLVWNGKTTFRYDVCHIGNSRWGLLIQLLQQRL
jgi:hypothetical protein